MLPVNQKGQMTHNVIPHGQVHRHAQPAGPYIHQPFPTVRYGPGGQTTTVNDADELAAVGPEWREFPYPTKPTGTTPLTLVVDSGLAREHDALKEAHANLQQSHDALANDKATLQSQLEELSGQLRQAEVAYASLQKQHAMVKGQLSAARKKDPNAATATPEPEPPAGDPPTPPAGTPEPPKA